MWRDDHLLGVGRGQDLVEDGLRVGEPELLDEAVVGHKAVPPAHGVAQLAAALDEEKGGWRDLHGHHGGIRDSSAHSVEAFHDCVTLPWKTWRSPAGRSP